MNIFQKTTPNFGSRDGYKPEIIVLHIMAGTLAGTDSWFASPESQVSAHYGVGFNGEVHQYVPEGSKAWANGRVLNPTAKLIKPGVNPNLYTLSIEHEGQDLSVVHEAQINSTIQLIKSMCDRYNIPIDRDHIIGHYEIYAAKPDCPATNKSIIDRIIRQVKELNIDKDPIVKIDCPQSKVAKILEIIKII